VMVFLELLRLINSYDLSMIPLFVALGLWLCADITTDFTMRQGFGYALPAVLPWKRMGVAGFSGSGKALLLARRMGNLHTRCCAWAI